MLVICDLSHRQRRSSKTLYASPKTVRSRNDAFLFDLLQIATICDLSCWTTLMPRPAPPSHVACHLATQAIDHLAIRHPLLLVSARYRIHPARACRRVQLNARLRILKVLRIIQRASLDNLQRTKGISRPVKSRSAVPAEMRGDALPAIGLLRPLFGLAPNDVEAFDRDVGAVRGAGTARSKSLAGFWKGAHVVLRRTSSGNHGNGTGPEAGQ